MSSVAVGPSGVIYVTGDLANVLYRIEPFVSLDTSAGHLDRVTGA